MPNYLNARLSQVDSCLEVWVGEVPVERITPPVRIFRFNSLRGGGTESYFLSEVRRWTNTGNVSRGYTLRLFHDNTGALEL